MSEAHITDSSVKRTLTIMSGGLLVMLVGLILLARVIVY